MPLLLGCVPVISTPWFSGRIVYRNVFVTLAGDTIHSNLGPENRFYIQGDKYKTYGADKQLLDLYAGKNSVYQFFKDGKPVAQHDAEGHKLPVVIRRLPTTSTVLGYPCQAIQLIQGGVSTIVYFSAGLRVNPKGFSKDTNGYWYALLKATNGALPLRIISVNSAQGFTATSEATSVQAMLLNNEFIATAPAR